MITTGTRSRAAVLLYVLSMGAAHPQQVGVEELGSHMARLVEHRLECASVELTEDEKRLISALISAGAERAYRENALALVVPGTEALARHLIDNRAVEPRSRAPTTEQLLKEICPLAPFC